MAKSKRAKKEKSEATTPEASAAVPAVVPSEKGSLLSVAFAAFQAGDMVLARQAAQRVKEGKGGTNEGAAVERVAKALFVPGSTLPTDPQVVAAELVSRTQGPGKPFLFALLSAGLWVLLVVLAAVRYG
jgi:hypothetical protein